MVTKLIASVQLTLALATAALAAYPEPASALSTSKHSSSSHQTSTLKTSIKTSSRVSSTQHSTTLNVSTSIPASKKTTSVSNKHSATAKVPTSISASKKTISIPATSKHSTATSSAATGSIQRGSISNHSYSTPVSTAGACTATNVVTITPSPVVTTTTYTSTSSIDGFLATLYVNPATVPATVLISTSTSGTFTTTYSDYIVSASTYTQFPPGGFIPILDSISTATFIEPPYFTNPLYDPNPHHINKRDAYYGSTTVKSTKTAAKTSCPRPTTTIARTITAAPSTSTVTITKSTTYIFWELYGTSTPYDEYITVTPTRTTTITTTAYARTTTKRINLYTATDPITLTSTVYAACATNNYANYAVASDGNVRAVTGSNDPNFIPFYNTDSAYLCCSEAIKAGAGGWLWDPRAVRTCAFLGGSNAINCRNGSRSAQYIANVGAPESAPVSGNGSLAVLGNGYCGEWTTLQ